MTEVKRISTDVLVIGGGIAGCFAAIHARESGAEVILAEKGYVGSAGQTPYAGSLMVFDPDRHDRNAWIKQFRERGDYVAHMGWVDVLLEDSKGCFEDLLSYGVEFFREEDGTVREVSMNGQSSKAVLPLELSLSPVLRKQVLKSGTTIMDRSMVVDLIQTEGRVAGAVGIAVSDGAPFAIDAKAVIICTGASGLKPPSWPISNLTADGDVMAYRAGAAITGKEFVDAHQTSIENPSYSPSNPITRDMSLPSHGEGSTKQHLPSVNSEGKSPRGLVGLNLSSAVEIHEGRGPIYSSKVGGPQSVPCASFGMATHKAEGIWPVGMHGGTGVDGLYAAGDSLGTMMCGASYAGIGSALTGSAITGKRAAKAAVAETAQYPTPNADSAVIDALFDRILAPIRRTGGHKPAWAIRILQNTMMPYYVLMVKREDRLQNALDHVRYLRTEIAPKFRAEDAHELRLAIEAENMMMNCEFKLVAAMARKESRGTHIREDYPLHNEEDFSGWISVREQEGNMVTEMHPMPEAWRKTAEERYLDFVPLGRGAPTEEPVLKVPEHGKQGV